MVFAIGLAVDVDQVGARRTDGAEAVPHQGGDADDLRLRLVELEAEQAPAGR